jgi:hypothetical protein
MTCKRAAEQINGREGETATLLSRGLFTLNLRVIGFAPRHLKRWAANIPFYTSDNSFKKNWRQWIKKHDVNTSMDSIIFLGNC